MQETPPGIVRRTRPPTEDEVRELLTPAAAARFSRWGCVMRAVGAGAPGLMSALLAGALASNARRAAAWGEQVFLASVALVVAPFALLLLLASARNLWWAVAGPARPRAPMSESEARRAPFEEVVVRADGAWRVEMADDGAAALLVCAGDRCVFVRGGLVAGLLRDGEGGNGGEDACAGDGAEGAGDTLPREVTVVSRRGRLRRVEARGQRIALGVVLVQEREPRRGLAWWQHEVLEFGVGDLPGAVRAQVGMGPAPGGN